MSSGDPSVPCPPTVPPKLEKAIQRSYRALSALFLPDSDDDTIQDRLNNTWFNVHSAISQAGDLNQRERLRSESEFNDYLTAPENNRERKREFLKLLGSMAKQEVSWRELFKNEAFLKPGPDKITDPTTARTTTHAWDGEFKGDIACVLYDTIADYLSKDRNPYARLTTVVNSSGTGKSRMVDRLGMEVVTIPMCLRQRSGEGFPPIDMGFCDWLRTNIGDRALVQKRLDGIAYSLLKTTHRQLETIAKEERDIPEFSRVDKVVARANPRKYVPLALERQRRLAAAFREHMTKGQTYHTTNSNRTTFYTDVLYGCTNMTEQFVKRCQQVDHDEKGPEHRRYVSQGEDLQGAGKMLCRFLDEHDLLDSDKGPRRPLVVLAFDEADALTDNPPNQELWNLFSELRRVLRQIQHLPIFSLFLSTAGHFEKFSPVIHSDPSARAREPDNSPLDPISEISFDDIAYPALKGTIRIDIVVEIDWISHLGRPLFGSYWDNLPHRCKNESTIMDFVKQKLLDGPTELRNGNWAGSLACLSTRFALEFDMDVTYAQVERHMRLCIAATTGFEKMDTISGSEPLLAEAAYELMKDTRINAVCHLARHADLNCIDRGRRGELVAALLIMQTYDAARVISGGRSVSVANFMEALLPPSEYNTLLQSGPTSWPIRSYVQLTFKAMFKDYSMWFNHIIKVEKKEMISIDHLWKFVVRGAMILCATNQQGIDIVLPVCHMTQNLGPDSVTAIIIQVKNAKDYKATLQADLFDAMDSVVKSAIFSKLPEPGVDSDSDSDSDANSTTPAEPSKKRKIEKVTEVTSEPVRVNPKAVIRMVFALASPEPAIVFRERPTLKHNFGGYATFDLWLAGFSNETFRQVEDADLEYYKTLLERSLGPHDAFELKDVPEIGKKAKKSRGPCRRKMAPLTLPGHAHHHIHRNPKRLGEGSGGQPGVAS